MDFSYIQAESWPDLTSNEQDEIINLAFDRDVKTASGWADIAQEEQIELRQLYQSQAQEANQQRQEAEFDPEPEDRGVGGFLKDTGIDLAKGIVGTGQAAVGLLDMATVNLAGDALGFLGYDAEKTNEFLSSGYSEARQASNKEVAETKGFWNTIGSLVDNPDVAFGSIIESSPMSLGSAGIARSVATKMLGTALATEGITAGTTAAKVFATKFFTNKKVIATITAAGASAEGLFSAGQIQEQARATDVPYYDSILPALGTGLGTAGIGIMSSKIPGLQDAEAQLASAGMGAIKKGFKDNLWNIAKTMVKEGPIEEGLQSSWEKGMSNIIYDQPFTSGMPEAAAQGTIVGAGQGGGMSAVSNTLNSAKRLADAVKPPTKIQEAPNVDEAVIAAKSEVDDIVRAVGVRSTPEPLVEPPKETIAVESDQMGDFIQAELARNPVVMPREVPRVPVDNAGYQGQVNLDPRVKPVEVPKVPVSDPRADRVIPINPEIKPLTEAGQAVGESEGLTLPDPVEPSAPIMPLEVKPTKEVVETPKLEEPIEPTAPVTEEIVPDEIVPDEVVEPAVETPIEADPVQIATVVNEELPGNDIKYDGVFGSPMPGRDTMHQFTPQAGDLAGRTLTVTELTPEAVKAKMAEMTSVEVTEEVVEPEKVMPESVEPIVETPVETPMIETPVDPVEPDKESKKVKLSPDEAPYKKGDLFNFERKDIHTLIQAREESLNNLKSPTEEDTKMLEKVLTWKKAIKEGTATDKDLTRWGKETKKNIIDSQLRLSKSKLQFQAGQQAPGEGVSLKDIQSSFKGQKVFIGPNKEVSVVLDNGQGITITQVKDFGEGDKEIAIKSGQMSPEGIIFGSTEENKIKLSQDFAKNIDMLHEIKHTLTNIGVLTAKDDQVLLLELNKLDQAGKLLYERSKMKDKDAARQEDLSNVWAQVLDNRKAYRGTKIGEIIQKVLDFIDGLKVFITGRDSMTGLAKEFESGKIFKRTPEGQVGQDAQRSTFEPAPKWYSALIKGIESIKQPSAPATQWKSMIKKLPVKAEEVAWVGVNEWLDEQTGKVTKEELLDFIAANNVQVEETIKEAPEGYEAYWIEGGKENTFLIRPTLAEAKQAVKDLGGMSTMQYRKTKDIDLADDRKFSSYQEPGGENYKELLLTVPVKQTNEDQIRLDELNKKSMSFTITRKEHMEQVVLRKKMEAKEYKSSHFDEPNIIAHVRFNERTDADGNRVLFLEEVQSDWHQAGRKEGYNREGIWIAYNTQDNNQTKEFKIEKDLDSFLDNNSSWDAIEESGSVPDAPFKKSWPLLTLKRMVRYAAENGFDKIAWTTGEQQAVRYDLSKQVDRIEYKKILFDNSDISKMFQEANIKLTKNSNGSLTIRSSKQMQDYLIDQFYADKLTKEEFQQKEDLIRFGVGTKEKKGNYEISVFDKNENEIYGSGNATAKELEDVVGKEIVQKMESGEGKKNDTSNDRILSGLDLKVGGEGMKAFYDKMLPSMAKKFFKKFGGRIEETTVKSKDSRYGIYDSNDEMLFIAATKEEAEKDTATLNEKNPGENFTFKGMNEEDAFTSLSMTITPEMKSTAVREGMPMFQTSEAMASTQPFDVPEVSTRRETANYAIIDVLAPFVKTQKAINEEALPEDQDYVLSERLRKNQVGAAVTKAKKNLAQPIIDLMVKNTYTMTDVDEALYGQHAPEANKRLRLTNARRFLLELADTNEKDYLKAKIDEIDQDMQSKESKEPGLPNSTTQKLYLELLRKELQYTVSEDTKKIAAEWARKSEKFSGITDDEAAKIHAEWADDEDMQKILTLTNKLTKATLDVSLESGRITQEEYDAFNSTFKHYVPLQREGHTSQSGIFGTGQGIVNLGKDYKIRGGSEARAVNMFSNALIQHEQALRRAGKAETGQTFLNLVEANPNKDFWTISEKTLVNAYDDHGNIYKKDDYKIEENDIPLKLNGKYYIISMNRDNEHAMRIAKHLKGSDTNTGMLVTGLSKFNRILATVYTGLNPEFIITNPVRDIQIAAVNLSSTEIKDMTLRVMKDLPKAAAGLQNAIRGDATTEWGKWAKEAEEAGMLMSWSEQGQDVEKLAKSINREVKLQQKNPLANVARTTMKLGKLIKDYNMIAENMTRLAAYKNAREAGMSEAKAALLGKELTVNFEQKGLYGEIYNSLYLFSSAGVQGSTRLIKGLVKSSKARKMVGGLMISAMGVAITNGLMGGDDDEGKNNYANVNGYDKERNMIFIVPNSNGKVIKIPLGWGLNFFWNIGTELGDLALAQMDPDNFKYDPLEGASRLAKVGMDAFNPIQSATLAQTISPTIADPIVQVAENKTFSGAPLMPERNKFEDVPTPDSQRYWKTVRPSTKAAAEWMNSITKGDKVEAGKIDVSPETLDLLIDTFTGGLGKFVEGVAGLPKALSEEELDVRKLPIVRRFVGTTNKNKARSDFYDNAKEVKTLLKKIKVYPERRREFMRDPRFRMAEALKSTERQVKALRKVMDKVKSEKSKARLEDRIKKLQTKFNDRFEKRIKK